MFDDSHVVFHFGDAVVAADNSPTPVQIEATGATTLVQIGNNYFVSPTGGGPSVQLNAFGAPVFAGQFGAFVPIAAEATAGGYIVAWKATNADQYTVLNANANGTFLSHAFFVVAGKSLSLESVEPTLQQDLNGDGTVGVVTSTIELTGATKIMQVADGYYFYPAGGSSGPQLSFKGAMVAAGQFGAWVPIAAEATAGGYEVAWKLGSADSYVVWSVDSTGHWLSQSAIVSGSSYVVQSQEPVLLQDLNGDGTTGAITTVLEASGATSLVQRADAYFLGSSGPQLSFHGAAVTPGMFGGWTPTGVEAVAGGYDIAWKMGADAYIVWHTDSTGAWQSQSASMAGSALALQSFEPAFGQDLNGDGTTGVVTSTLEATGATKLMQLADSYYLHVSGGSSGPQLSFQGAPVTVGEFGSWVPVAAEAVAGGYDVAWKMGSTDSYVVWHVDSAGHWLSQSSVMLGGTLALQSFETVFQQDLNGDGTTGAITTVLEASGATSLVQHADAYFLGSSGPQLLFHETAVVTGLFGTWAPVAAEAVASGYDVAWKMGSADAYVVWAVDSSGHWLSQTGVMSGGTLALQSFETVFQQDLNGDGATGPVASTLEVAGTTKLVQVADGYRLDATGGASGPQLFFNGSAVTAGMFGAWAPVAAEAVAGGYDVAWKFGSSDSYVVWSVDGAGHWLSQSAVFAGSAPALRSLEPLFHQDVNGDGIIG